MKKKKLIRVTTVPLSLNLLLRNQLKVLNAHFEVVALSSPGENLEEVQNREGVRTVAIPIEREISIFKDCASLLRLIWVFIKERPEIVHANTPKGSLLSLIAAKLTFVPHRIYTITGLRYETELGWTRSILMLMEKLTCLCATQVVAESLGVKRTVSQHQLTSKKISIIGNGNINGIDEIYWDSTKCDPDARLAVKQRLQLNEDDFIFLFVGRVVRDKGINELVRSFINLQIPSKLIIVGPLEIDSKLDDDVLLEIENNTNIKQVGFQNDVRLYFSISNVLVLPSYREGFPNVILQAGTMGLPVIVTDVHGTEEIVDEFNGIIVERRNQSSLSNAMLSLHKNYTSFNSQYCREKVIAKYSQQFFYAKLIEFYYNLRHVSSHHQKRD